MAGKTRPLTPCPFCGARQGLVMVGVCTPEVDDGVIVKCPDCLTEGPIGDSESKARKLWNRRLQPAREVAHGR